MNATRVGSWVMGALLVEARERLRVLVDSSGPGRCRRGVVDLDDCDTAPAAAIDDFSRVFRAR